MGKGLSRALSELAPTVSGGRSALDVIRITGEGLARLGLGVIALQLVDGQLFVLFVSDERGVRSTSDRRSGDRVFALRARVEPGGAAFRVLAEGRSVFEPGLDPFATFLGSKPGSLPLSNAVVTPVFVRGLPWGFVLFTSPTMTEDDSAVLGLFGAHVSGAIALASCSRALGQLEEELIGRERLASIGELAATIVHEVRNPLGVLFNSIASLKQIFRRDFDETARSAAEKLVSIFAEETERLDAISNDLLMLARPTLLRKRPTRVEDLLRAIAAIVPDLREGTAVDVRLDLSQELPVFTVDDRLLHQALLNLVINAVQAMPEGGCLTLRSRIDFGHGGPFVNLDVSDTGSGISRENEARIFEPFFTTKANGTGLGLPLVRRVVEAHRGKLGFVSGTGGTTFTIRLPLPNDNQSHVTLKREARSVPHLRVVGTGR